MESIIKFGYSKLGVDKIAAIVVLFLVWAVRIVKKKIENRRADQFARVSEMILEIEKGYQKNKAFIVEQVFSNRFGFLVDFPVINFLLSSKTPSGDILKYIQGMRYLTFCSDTEVFFCKGRLSKGKLKFRAVLWSMSYWFCFALALSLILLISQIEFASSVEFGVYLMFVLALLIMTYVSVDSISDPNAAIYMVEKYGR